MQNYSAIKEMFYGNRGNYESVNLSAEEKSLLAKVVEIEGKFLKLIKNEDKVIDLYDELNAQVGELHALNFASAYEEGFRFGFLMALDVLK